MSEIEHVTTFRAHVAAPSEPVRHAARRLVLVAAAESPRRHAPRRIGAALAVAAIAAGVFVATSLVGGGGGVLERAQAAIDPQGRILHVVAAVEARDGTVTRGESWVRPDGGGRSVDLTGSAPKDCLASETELRCFDAARNVVDVYRYDPAAVAAGRRYAELPGYRVDQPESIHRAFAEGYAQLVGPTRLAGRAVYEIRLAVPYLDASGQATPRFDEATSPFLYVDRTSYLPVAERFPDAGSTTTYETYEFLPATPELLRVLALPTRPDTRVVVHPAGEGPNG